MTRPWVQAEFIQIKRMAKQKASVADIARSLGRRVGSVKAKIRECGISLVRAFHTHDHAVLRDLSPRGALWRMNLG